MKRLFAVLALVMPLALWSAAAVAVPTADQVQAAVQKGDYAQAESMMREVIAAKPTSARAHYVYAEILAHNGRFEQASSEARRAQSIDPAISFTQPDKFAGFQQMLEREQSQATARAAPSDGARPAMQPSAPVEQRSSGMPGWLWGAGIAVVGLLLWRMLSRRRTASAGGMAPSSGGYATTGGAGYAPGYGPGYGPAGAAPGGSGMLGVGLAAAGGVAAGMLAEKLIDGHREHGGDAAGAASGGWGNGGMGDGLSALTPRDDAARQLEDRPIDFGSGDNGWDAGGSDLSGGGGGDDGWS